MVVKMIVELIPAQWTLVLTEASLLILGFAAEKYYVSRLSSFSNAIALLVHFLSQDQTGPFLTAYVDIAIVLGVVGLLAYLRESSLPSTYYDLSYFLFSSVNVGLVIAFGPEFGLALALGIVVQIALAALYDHDEMIHYGEYPGSVKRFAQKNNFVQKRGNQKHVIDLSGWFK